MKVKYLKGVIIGLASTVLFSCANMPDAVVSYYMPKSKVNITVTQTASCVDIKNPIVKTNVSFKTVYSADNTNPKTIDFSILDTWYSSADATITLTSDGRLTSFNSTTKGNGTDLIDTIVSAVSATKIDFVPEDTTNACNAVNLIAGKTKGVQNPLSVVISSVATFSGTQDNPKIKTSTFKLSGYPDSTYKLIEPALGRLTFKGRLDKLVAAPVTTKKTDQSVKLVEPAIILLNVVRKDLTNNNNTIYTAFAPAPQLGNEYTLPIPDPPLFGKNELNLSIYESGRIKSIKYGSTNGAKDLGGAIVKLDDQFEDQSNTEKAAELKAQADVIAQQQRLILCEATPTNCK